VENVRSSIHRTSGVVRVGHTPSASPGLAPRLSSISETVARGNINERPIKDMTSGTGDSLAIVKFELSAVEKIVSTAAGETRR